MGFDAVAFAMGKAGASRNLLSALMGGGSGGGGGVTLETSGWVRKLNGNASVSGNVITLSSGSSSHSVQISPPGASFAVGDEVVIAFTVKDNYKQININTGGNKSNTTMTSATGYTMRTSTYDYCRETGNDVLTYAFNKAVTYVSFSPTVIGGGGSADAYATIDITGIKYNGTTIFGRV